MPLLLVFAAPSAIDAHDIPRGVSIKAYAHPVGDRLTLLVRLPLEAVRDIEFPLRDRTFLEFSRADDALRQAAIVWVAGQVVVTSAERRFAETPVSVVARASMPNDAAFLTFESARRSFDRPVLPDSIELPWAQAMLDVQLEYQLQSDATRAHIDVRWAALGVHTNTVLHVVRGDGVERVLAFDGNPGVIPLSPTWWDAARRFVALGFEHILDGIDHLLFLLCLVIPVRRIWPLVGIVTSFTVAHSVTLVASAFGMAPSAAWFPPFVETLIALSIVYMACENIVGARVERRWMMAFGFGLIHGFGFSFALGESLQFAGSHLIMALAAFNLGVEVGQLLVLAIAVPVLAVLYRYAFRERVGVILLSALVLHQAWHWMTERFDAFRAYEVAGPEVDRLFIADIIRLLMLALIAGGLLWLLSLLVTKVRTMRAARVVAPLLMTAIVGGALAMPSTLSAQTRTTMAGVFTAKQADQGRNVFNSSCLGCHTAASHTGTAFIGRWVGEPLVELVNYLSTQMPKSDPGSLTENEYVWVTAYLLRLNGMPAGQTELSGDPKVLERIRIDTVKVAPNGGAMPNGGATLSHLRPALHHFRR